MSGRTKRETGRQPIGLMIELRDAEASHLGDATALNLSEGGVLVAQLPSSLQRTIAVGNALRFSFALPTGPVEGQASVVWVDRDTRSLGLQFQQIDHPEGIEHLLEFLRSSFVRERE